MGYRGGTARADRPAEARPEPTPSSPGQAARPGLEPRAPHGRAARPPRRGGPASGPLIGEGGAAGLCTTRSVERGPDASGDVRRNPACPVDASTTRSPGTVIPPDRAASGAVGTAMWRTGWWKGAPPGPERAREAGPDGPGRARRRSPVRPTARSAPAPGHGVRPALPGRPRQRLRALSRRRRGPDRDLWRRSAAAPARVRYGSSRDGPYRPRRPAGRSPGRPGRAALSRAPGAPPPCWWPGPRTGHGRGRPTGRAAKHMAATSFRRPGALLCGRRRPSWVDEKHRTGPFPVRSVPRDLHLRIWRVRQ